MLDRLGPLRDDPTPLKEPSARERDETPLQYFHQLRGLRGDALQDCIFVYLELAYYGLQAVKSPEELAVSEQAWEQQWGQGRCQVGVLLKLHAWRITVIVSS